MQAATRSVIFYCKSSSLQLCNEGRPLENQKLKWHVFVSIDASKKSELWYTVCSILLAGQRPQEGPSSRRATARLGELLRHHSVGECFLTGFDGR